MSDAHALTEMWDIASGAGYANAVASLRMAVDMPVFADDADALRRAASMLEELRSASASRGLLINEAGARRAFMAAYVGRSDHG